MPKWYRRWARKRIFPAAIRSRHSSCVSRLPFSVVRFVRWSASALSIALLLTSCPVTLFAQTRDGQHDFDFEFGSWRTQLKRLLHPLSGSNEWETLEGTSVVRRVWDGRGNLGELEVGNAARHIEGLSLRVYNPQSRQWSIYWASSRDGAVGPPMIGGFKDGRGEFFDQETFEGKAIFVRFIFSDITATSFRLEQAFSNDGGKTWEPNWIATFTREKS
jgi:hypothetical protein